MKFFTAALLERFFVAIFLFCLRFADLRFLFLAFLVVIFIGWGQGGQGGQRMFGFHGIFEDR